MAWEQEQGGGMTGSRWGWQCLGAKREAMLEQGSGAIGARGSRSMIVAAAAVGSRPAVPQVGMVAVLHRAGR